MMDRVAANPGRMLITPENGDPAFYATVEMADNPSVVGTPLNKDSLLKDATAVLFGLGTGAVPDEILQKLSSIGSYYFAFGEKNIYYYSETPFSIDLGFSPKLVVIYSDSNTNPMYVSPGYDTATHSPNTDIGILTPNCTRNNAKITETGFIWDCPDKPTSGNSYVHFFYFAFR